MRLRDPKLDWSSARVAFPYGLQALVQIGQAADYGGIGQGKSQ